jgi:hypothetical protein
MFRNMKRKLKITLITILLSSFYLTGHAQQPPHPNGGNTPGVGNGPVGGGAALGGGMYILIAMGLAYGLRRYYMNRNTNSIL